MKKKFLISLLIRYILQNKNMCCIIFIFTLKTFYFSLRNVCKRKVSYCISNALFLSQRNFRISRPRYDLMEFFDDEKNWGESEVKSGEYDYEI